VKTDILVADDSDEDATITLLALRRAAPDVTLFRVTDGEQALQFLFSTGGYAARPPDLPRLVLFDLWMPNVDGLQVLQALRENPATQNLPAVLFSSCSNPVVVEHALSLGASEYRVKPVNTDEYRAEVERIVARWIAATPTETLSSESAA
jgi:two-component system, response regulator